MAWWGDIGFSDYLERFGELDGNNSDRRWAVHQLIRLIAAVEGDTAEVGVYQGAMSWLILKANAGRRKHHIFDSFEGLSQPEMRDGSHWRAGVLAASEAEVVKNLSEFAGRFNCYKGWVPERFPEVESLRFAFVHIDVDLFQPTRDAIEFFYSRMSNGGIIVCDDYGFTSCPGATEACDLVLSDKPEKMIALPDGGGFFIKGVRTGAADGRQCAA